MKTLRLWIVLLWGLLNACVIAGGMPVIDAVAIASQRLAAQKALLEALIQEGHQLEQIDHAIQQVNQIDSYLKKFGDPEAIKNLEGLDELLKQLKAAPVIENPVLKPEELDSEAVFRPLDTKISPQLKKEITVDGKVEAVRNGELYLPEVAERRAYDDYQKIQTSVMARRAKLRQAIADSMTQLKQASTSSEVQKAAGVLTALQTELQATDHELDFAANEVQVRAQMNATEKAVQQKASVEQNRVDLRVSTRNEIETFKLFTQPAYFNKKP